MDRCSETRYRRVTVLVAWAPLLAGGVALWAVLTALGTAVLAPLRVPKSYWLLVGAPVGLAVTGTATFVSGFLGLTWGVWAPVLVAALMAGVGALVHRLHQRSSPLDWKRAPRASSFWWVAGGAFVFAAVQFGVILLVAEGPDAIPIMGDAQFHLAGSLLVAETGDVSPLTGLGRLYEPMLGVSYHYYPTFWHGLMAMLMSVVNIGFAHNLLLFTLGFLVWPAALGALAVLLTPKQPWVGALAPLLAISVLAYPGDVFVYVSLGPYGLGLVFIPAVLALLVAAVDNPRVWVIPLALVLIGAFAAHPSVGLLVTAPVAMVLLVEGVRRLVGLENRVLAAVVGVSTAVAILAVSVALLSTSYYQSLASYERATPGIWGGLKALFGQAVFYWPVTVGWVATAGFALLGVWAHRRSRSAQLILVGSVPYLVLYLASVSPESSFRGISGIWWKDFTRLIVPPLVVLVVFAALGVAAAAARISKKFPDHSRGSLRSVSAIVTAAVVAAVGYGVGSPSRLETMAHFALASYSLDPELVTPLSSDTVTLLEASDEHFKEGALIGPHASGVGFAPVYGSMTSFMPMPIPYTADQWYLQENFKHITEDPRVCEILEANGVVGFLEREAAPDEETEQRQEGLYGVDTSTGFELVAESGDLALWEITACN